MIGFVFSNRSRPRTLAPAPVAHAKLKLPQPKEPRMKFLALTTLLLASLCAQTPQPPPKVTPGTPSPAAPTPPAAQAPAAPAVSPDTVVVEIDGKKYTAAEVDKIIESVPAQYQPQVRANPQALTQIFLMKRLADDAVKAGLDQQSPFKELIEFDRINILMRAQMTISPNKMPIDKAMVEKYYKDHQDQFKQVKVRVIQIMFSPSADKTGADGKKMLSEVEAKAKIDDLRKQALAGADFAKLATENSDDKTSAAKGGDFGIVNRKSSYPDAIKSAVLVLKAGGISDPVKQPTSFYLIKADEVTVQPLDDVSGDVTQGVRQERFTEDMKNLQEKYKVKVENPSYFGPHPGPQLQPVR
jgi:peptidyl-prolyl cis-trans isomerase C